MINSKDFKDYEENQRLSTIKVLKCVIFLFILINLGFLIFIILLEHKISETEAENGMYSKEIATVHEANEIKNDQYFHMLINILSLINISVNSFTSVFAKKEEFEFVMSLINYSPSFTYICYSGITDGDSPRNFHYHCGLERQLVVIELETGEKFGGYLAKRPLDAENPEEIVTEDKEAFLFSITKKKIYPIKEGKKVYTLYKDGFFMFGEEDIVIKPGWLRNPENCYSKFPQSYGDDSTSSLELTNGHSKLNIIKLEVFTLL